jgi:hypothetical protein
MFATQFAEITGAQVIIPRSGSDVQSLQAAFTTLPPYRSGSDSETDLEEVECSYNSHERVHEYRPLEADEMRLLVLNPGSTDDPIECYLEHYTVNQAKTYQALSYVWGDHRNQEVIQVDGCSFKVTKNLKDFLIIYREQYECHVLWIDAVCINQNDIPERNAQIRLMKRIYEDAESVVIWLGNEMPDTGAALKHLEYVYHSLWLPRLDEEESAQKALATFTSEDVPFVFPGIRDHSNSVWKGIQDMLDRPWWSRIWVYQEATAPAKNGSIVFCGPRSIDFDKILTVNKIIRYMVSRVDGLVQLESQGSLTGVYMEMYLELRRDYHQRGISPFLRLSDLLPTLRGFDATDPRDKLYALIPTSLDGAELLDVNYEQSVEEVYVNAALSLIRKHQNLDILGHCTKSEGDSSFSLPSWVPDWTSKSNPVHFFKRGQKSQGTRIYTNGPDEAEIGKLYNASKDPPADFHVDESSRTLFCKGISFDVVDAVSPSAGETYDCSNIAKEWVEWLKSMKCPMPTWNALLRTLVADCYTVGVDIAVRGCTVNGPSNTMMNSLMDSQWSHYPSGQSGPHPATFRRRLILTGKGYLGLTAERVENGDLVTVMMGGQLPIILRKTEAHFVLIGEAYIDGIMDGEAMTQHERSSLPFETFGIW